MLQMPFLSLPLIAFSLLVGALSEFNISPITFILSEMPFPSEKLFSCFRLSWHICKTFLKHPEPLFYALIVLFLYSHNSLSTSPVSLRTSVSLPSDRDIVWRQGCVYLLQSIVLLKKQKALVRGCVSIVSSYMTKCRLNYIVLRQVGT